MKLLNKKITITLLSLLFLILGSLTFIKAQTSPTPALILSPTNLATSPGEEKEVNLILDTDNQAVSCVDVVINYNPAQIEILEIIPNQQEFKTFTPIDNEQNLGFDSQKAIGETKIEFSTLTFDPVTKQPTLAFSGVTQLATLRVRLLESKAILSFDFEVSNPPKTTDANLVSENDGEDILAKVANNRLATPVCLADIDQNGSVNLADVTFFLGKWNQGCLGCFEDLDNNFLINLSDITFLLPYWQNLCQ